MINVIRFSASGRARRTFIALMVGSLVALTSMAGTAGATETGVPDAGGKAASPATDLVRYPKLTEAQLDERVAQDRKAQAGEPGSGATDVMTTEVMSVETSPERTTVTLYTPAPGVTPEALADMLRKQGIKDVRLVGYEPAGAGTMSEACEYGQATTLTCLPSYWHNNGYNNPIVRFNDHSGANWPVDSAVYKWNMVPNIDSWYYYNRCPFMAGARCVDVWSGNYGPGWTGQTVHTYEQWGDYRAFRDGGPNYIKLNDYYNPYYYNFTRNNVATHEAGHMLGLGHNRWSGDVMYYIANKREDIGGENPVCLANIYNEWR
jgi:hypothetical protein